MNDALLCAISKASAICMAIERDRSTASGPFAIRSASVLDQFPDERGRARGIFDAMNLGDIGVIQRREHLRFAFEPGESISIGGELGRQYLDCDGPAEPCITAAVDLAHATAADQREDFVSAEPGAGVEGQAFGARRL